ncbi:uncharacterized protein PV07_04737 [Cladophialophora immunda]|uniref:Uncharacterized protein n=1 Tax=Cladophialophora immunda TaxID=569365 RepID=A0A0D2AUH0_9EURO|nr:uncharacterized protein PV07_04737 [Cladophialophora immunda]KIW28882.1 hypothetical protein PV07_04737 [Cladophialophora immunda]
MSRSPAKRSVTVISDDDDDAPIPSVETANQVAQPSRIPDIGYPNPRIFQPGEENEAYLTLSIEYVVKDHKKERSMTMEAGRDKPILHVLNGWADAVNMKYPTVNLRDYQYSIFPHDRRSGGRIVLPNQIFLGLRTLRDLHVHNNNILQILPDSTTENENEYIPQNDPLAQEEAKGVKRSDSEITRRQTRSMGPAY